MLKLTSLIILFYREIINSMLLMAISFRQPNKTSRYFFGHKVQYDEE